jgi:hypothetical protein
MPLSPRSLSAGLCALVLVLLAGCNGDDSSSIGGLPGGCASTPGQQLRLVEAATAHAQDMALNTFMSHTGSDGSSPLDRVARTGYPTTSLGENVAMGTIYTTAEAAVAAWMNSTEGHREIILGTSFVHVGIGHATSGINPVFHYWCADFGSCSDAGELPDGGCHP